MELHNLFSLELCAAVGVTGVELPELSADLERESDTCFKLVFKPAVHNAGGVVIDWHTDFGILTFLWYDDATTQVPILRREWRTDWWFWDCRSQGRMCPRLRLRRPRSKIWRSFCTPATQPRRSPTWGQKVEEWTGVHDTAVQGLNQCTDGKPKNTNWSYWRVWAVSSAFRYTRCWTRSRSSYRFSWLIACSLVRLKRPVEVFSVNARGHNADLPSIVKCLMLKQTFECVQLPRILKCWSS